MKSLRLFALLLILLLAPTAQAEKPLVVESAWSVANHNYLVSMLSSVYQLDRNMLAFPEEIESNDGWAMATLTDGNEVWTVIRLPLKEDAYLSRFVFGFKMRANAIIASVFPDGSFKMSKSNSGDAVFLFSTGLDLNDITVQILLNSHWQTLAKKSDFAFIQYYSERTLLPTLPPEQEDESAFIKHVRKRSADKYQEGKYVGTLTSHFLGVHVEVHGFRVIYEEVNAEESSPASDTEPLPFQFGGFINPDASTGAAFRLTIGKEDIEKAFFNIYCGTRVALPEDREEGKAYVTEFSPTVSKQILEEDDYHLIREGNRCLFYPKLHEDRPAEEGLLSNEELDKINEDLARSLAAFLTDVRQSVLSWDWEQPIDVALSLENEVLYLASSYPLGIMEYDWHLFEQQLKKIWHDHFQAVEPTEWDTAGDMFDGLFPIIQDQGEQTTVLDLPYHWIKFSLLGNDLVAVYGHESEKLYAAISSLGDLGEVSEERFDMMQQRLVQMVNDSQQAVAEKMEVPIMVFHSEMEEHTFRLDRESLGYGVRYTAHIENDSLETALALIANYGGDYLKQALPFLRGE